MLLGQKKPNNIITNSIKTLKKNGFQSLLEGFATFKVAATIANFQPQVEHWKHYLRSFTQPLRILLLCTVRHSQDNLLQLGLGENHLSYVWLPQTTPTTLPKKESGCPVVLLRNSEYQLPVGNAYQGPQCLQFMRGPMQHQWAFKSASLVLPRRQSSPISWHEKNILQSPLTKYLLFLPNSSLEAVCHIHQGHWRCNIWYNCPMLEKGRLLTLPDQPETVKP